MAERVLMKGNEAIAEAAIQAGCVTGVQTCALPIFLVTFSASKKSLAPEGETPLSPGCGGLSPHRVETRNNSLSPAEPARQEFKKEEQFLWQK